MAGHGLGFGAHSSSRQYAALGQNVPPSALTPSANWDGSAGSGFAGATPVDPARISAKPVCRLLTPPNQYFTNELVVGVWAGANQNGSMLDDLGIEKVIAHCEGRTFEINAPSFYLYEDANGNPCRHLGWYVVLQHPGSDGHLQVYFEAVPKDQSMQHRVIGPYQFSPQAILHDFELEVAATLPQIVGERYQTVVGALNYLTSVAAQNPLITISEAFSGDIGTANLYGGGEGYCTITASAPVTFRKPGPSIGAAQLFRPRVNGLWFKGENITFDFFRASVIYHEDASQRQHVFDGITATDSGGRYYTYLGGPKPIFYIARNNPWYLECDISVLPDPCQNASLVRGCKIYGGHRDATSAAVCVIGNQISDWSGHEWRAELDAMSVQFTGSSANATLELSGGNDANGRVFTAREDGVAVSTFIIDRTEAGFLADTNYSVENVVGWLNSLPGWSAETTDNSRRAAVLSISGRAGSAFPATDVKTNSLTLITMFDEHGDIWQLNANSAENTVFVDNLCVNNYVQSLFLNVPGGVRDCIIVNNAFNQNSSGPEFDGLVSQMSYPCNHVVVAHNSWSNQGLFLRTDLTFDPDGFCLIANNVSPQLEWVGASDSDVTIENNHLFAGASVPSGAIGTTVGGTMGNLLLDPDTGDFTPIGALLTSPKTPVVRYDLFGMARGIPVAVGATAGGGEVAPAITSSNPSGTYAENLTIGGTLTANKPVSWSALGPDVGALTLSAQTGDWQLEATDFETKTAYEFTFVATDDGGDSVAQIVAIAISDLDEIAPNLASPLDGATGTNSATLSVLTDEGNGTLYWYLSTSSTPPDSASLVAGIGAVTSGLRPVTAPGEQVVTITGLSAGTGYFSHFLHRDGAGNESAVISGDGFATVQPPASPVSVVSFATVYNAEVTASVFTGVPFTCSGNPGNVVLAIVTGPQSPNQSPANFTATLGGVPMTRLAGAAHPDGAERPIGVVFAAPNISAGDKIANVAVSGGLTACTILLVEVSGLNNSSLLANVSVSEGSAQNYSRSYTPNAAGNLILSTLVTRRGQRGPFAPDAGVTEILDLSSGGSVFSAHTTFAGYVIPSGTAAINVGANSNYQSAVVFLVTELNAA